MILIHLFFFIPLSFAQDSQFQFNQGYHPVFAQISVVGREGVIRRDESVKKVVFQVSVPIALSSPALNAEGDLVLGSISVLSLAEYFSSRDEYWDWLIGLDQQNVTVERRLLSATLANAERLRDPAFQEIFFLRQGVIQKGRVLSALEAKFKNGEVAIFWEPVTIHSPLTTQSSHLLGRSHLDEVISFIPEMAIDAFFRVGTIHVLSDGWRGNCDQLLRSVL